MNARSSHILKTHGFWGAGSGARRARRHTGGAAHILKKQGFWGRTRVRRIYLKRKGFGDEFRRIYLKRTGFGDERLN